MMKTGKPPWNMLAKLLSILPTDDIDLIVGPSVGEDSAIIRVRDGFLVVHSNPITAASRKIGWLSIHIAANDVAVRGVKPKWFLPVVLLPENADYNLAETIFSDIAMALKELGGVAVGGHTEVSPEIPRPIISTTAIGYTTSRVVLTRNARPGDSIAIMGRVGGEGVSVIALDFEDLLLSKGINKDLIEKARSYINEISVVDKALSISRYVSSMHDPTEGGILQGLREIALASNTEIEVDLDCIEVDPAVETIAGALGLDPLRLLSSGALIATIPASRIKDFVDIAEREKYSYSICGTVKHGVPGRVVIKRGSRVTEVVDKDIIDEIYKLW